MSNTKKEDLQSIMSNLQPNCCLKVDSKKWTNIREASGSSTTPNGTRTIRCKAWNSPAEYPSWVARCDIKGSDGTMLNPIIWKNVQGQKHPGKWEIAERQMPSVKMLFKTNTKGYKHPCIRLFVIQDTIGETKENNKWHSTEEPRTPKKQSFRLWWGAASPILNDV